MKKLARAVQFVLVLGILLAALGAAYAVLRAIYAGLGAVYEGRGALYEGLKGIYNFFASLPPDTWKPVLLVGLPGLAALLVALYQKYAERKKDIELKLRDEKVKTYTALLELVFDFFKASKKKRVDPEGENPTEEAELHEMQMRFMDVSRMLLMWGSADLVRRYADWRNLSNRPKKPSVTEVMSGLGGLVLQLRKDMGHKDKKLSYETLLSLFINDIDKLRGNTAPSAQQPAPSAQPPVSHLPNHVAMEAETAIRSPQLKSE